MKENMQENITLGLLVIPKEIDLKRKWWRLFYAKLWTALAPPRSMCLVMIGFYKLCLALVTRSMAPHHDAASTSCFSFKLK
jgi:hypothetical protein